MLHDCTKAFYRAGIGYEEGFCIFFYLLTFSFDSFILCLFPCPTDMVRLCSDTVARSGLNLAQTFTGPKKLRTSSGGSRGGARAHPPFPYFYTELRPEGPITSVFKTAPPLLISRSGSGTDFCYCFWFKCFCDCLSL